eukprot:718338_1
MEYPQSVSNDVKPTLLEKSKRIVERHEKSFKHRAKIHSLSDSPEPFEIAKLLLAPLGDDTDESDCEYLPNCSDGDSRPNDEISKRTRAHLVLGDAEVDRQADELVDKDQHEAETMSSENYEEADTYKAFLTRLAESSSLDKADSTEQYVTTADEDDDDDEDFVVVDDSDNEFIEDEFRNDRTVKVSRRDLAQLKKDAHLPLQKVLPPFAMEKAETPKNPTVVSPQQRLNVSRQLALHVQLMLEMGRDTEYPKIRESIKDLITSLNSARQVARARSEQYLEVQRPLPSRIPGRQHNSVTRLAARSVLADASPLPRINSVFDIPSLQIFEQTGSSLDTDPIVYGQHFDPVWSAALRDGKLFRGKSRILWSAAEEKLFHLGLEKYGTSIKRARRSDYDPQKKFVIGTADFKSIQRRFLPGKSIEQIAVKYNNSKQRGQLDKKFLGRNKCAGRKMTNEEMNILQQGVEEMGRKFKLISEKYLPVWDRKYLCRVYNRKILPRLKKAQKLKENLQLAKPPGQSEVFDVPPQLYDPHLVIQGNTKLEDAPFCIDDILDPSVASSSPPLTLTNQP